MTGVDLSAVPEFDSASHSDRKPPPFSRIQLKSDSGAKFCGFPDLAGFEKFPVSVEAKLSFIEPGRRWAHSPSPSKAPRISYQGTIKTSVMMLKTPGGL